MEMADVHERFKLRKASSSRRTLHGILPVAPQKKITETSREKKKNNYR